MNIVLGVAVVIAFISVVILAAIIRGKILKLLVMSVAAPIITIRKQRRGEKISGSETAITATCLLFWVVVALGAVVSHFEKPAAVAAPGPARSSAPAVQAPVDKDYAAAAQDNGDTGDGAAYEDAKRSAQSVAQLIETYAVDHNGVYPSTVEFTEDSLRVGDTYADTSGSSNPLMSVSTVDYTRIDSHTYRFTISSGGYTVAWTSQGGLQG